MAFDNKTQVVITAKDDTAAGLASVTRGLQGMESQAILASRALGAIGVTFSAAAAVAMVKGTIDAADGFNDLSQKVGISVKNLAGWTLAANQSGTSMESVAKGVKGLSTYMVEHGDKLRAAGITATDANGAMTQLADLFKGMPDGVEKTALAVQLFGKAGMDMIPMLNQGSQGLAEAQEKAKAYGERMAQLAPHADRFNDQLEEMKFQLQLVGIEMASHTAGPMATWLEANNEAIRIAGGTSEAMRLFVFNLDAMTTEKPAEEIRRLTRALHEYQAASGVGKFAQSPTGFLFGGREEDLQKQIAFLKLLERQEAMAGAAKLGDYRDARDLSLTTGPTMARAKGLLDKEKARAGKAEKQQLMLPGANNPGEAATLSAIIGAEKSAMHEARQEFEALQRMINRGEENELAAYYETAGEETMRLVAHQRDLKMASEDSFADMSRAIESWGSKAADTFADFVVDGKASFSDLINSMLKDIARLQAKRILDPATKGASDWLGNLFGGGNFFGGDAASAASQGFGMAGDAGSLLGFAGGGFTGNGARTGGLDGQGGFLAMLHPRETVIDHTTEGGGAGQAVVVNMSLNFAVGISQTVRAEVMNMMPAIHASAQSAVMEARLRGGSARLAFKG